MESLLAALEAASIPQALRFSRWGYAAINTAHVASIAVLFGSVLALDLRLMGFWQILQRDAFVRTLSRLAAIGLICAIVTGGLLFSTRATEYVALPIYLAKMGLVLTATAHALIAHRIYGRSLELAEPQRARTTGLVSLMLWAAVLVCGRFIAFVQ